MLETKVGNPRRRSRENVPVGWTEFMSEQPQIQTEIQTEERGTRLLALEYLPNGRKTKERPNILKPRLLAREYIPHKPPVVKGRKKGKGLPCMVVHKMTEHFKILAKDEKLMNMKKNYYKSPKRKLNTF